MENYEEHYKQFSDWWDKTTEKSDKWTSLERMAARDAWMAATEVKNHGVSHHVSNCDIEGCSQSVEYNLCEKHFDEMNSSGC